MKNVLYKLITAEHQGKTQWTSIDARRQTYWYKILVRYRLTTKGLPIRIVWPYENV